MLILGLVLLVLGLLLGIPPLFWVGVVLAAVGLVLLVAGGTGRSVGGRQYWF